MKVDLMGVQTINYTQKRTGKQASMCVLHRVHLRNGVAGCFVEEVRVYEGSDFYGLAQEKLVLFTSVATCRKRRTVAKILCSGE